MHLKVLKHTELF